MRADYQQNTSIPYVDLVIKRIAGKQMPLPWIPLYCPFHSAFMHFYVYDTLLATHHHLECRRFAWNFLRNPESERIDVCFKGYTIQIRQIHADKRIFYELIVIEAKSLVI